MQKTGELNGHGNVKSKESKVVVNVIKHTQRCIDLRVELTNHTSEENHGKSNSEEDINHPLRKSPKLGTFNGSSRDVDTEYDENNHKLTSEKVTVKIVSLVGDGSTLVGKRVGVLVKFFVDGGESNERPLPTLNHGKPDDGDPDQSVGSSRVSIRGKTSLSICNQAHNEDNRKY
jgi:hypothetical protein